MRRLVFDLESNGLLYDLTKIHCIVTYDLDTGGIGHFFQEDLPIVSQRLAGSLEEGLEYLMSADTLIGHNIANFDIPAMKKLGYEVTAEVNDTYLGSCMLLPNQKGHSIEAWIEKLSLANEGIEKIPIDDWSVLTQDMLNRCHDDVLANVKVYEYLEEHRWDKEIWDRNMSLETSVSRIQAEQEMHGVHFDHVEARRLVGLFDDLLADLESDIVTEAKPKVKQVGVSVNTPFKMSGDLKQVVINWFDGSPDVDLSYWKMTQLSTVAGPFSKVEFIPLNLRSPVQVTAFLLSLGWKPQEWNFKFNPLTGRKEKTSPKLTSKSWDSLPEGLGQKIGEYKTINHRRNSLLSVKHPEEKGALNTVRSDGRVPAKALTCATPTARSRHMETICNLPSANVDKDTGKLIWYPMKQRVLFGTEIRALYGVHPDHWQVGVDLAGIEARMMCHYCLAVAYASGSSQRIQDAEDLAELVLHGDFHQHNADFWGVLRSPHAKSGLYALMYSCGDAKLAETLGKPKSEGKRLKQLFWDGNPALAYLIEQLELTYAQKGHIVSLDGRIMDVRDKRKLLNTLLQGTAAIVFKQWMVEVDRYCGGPLLGDLRQIIQYHDECQLESCSPDRQVAIERGKDICKLATQVGKDLGVRVPIEAEAKIGKHWADCH
jgi:DNA polymerase I-like protein with 3'-5' exonuclease and polymerase domains